MLNPSDFGDPLTLPYNSFHDNTSTSVWIGAKGVHENANIIPAKHHCCSVMLQMFNKVKGKNLTQTVVQSKQNAGAAVLIPDAVSDT